LKRLWISLKIGDYIVIGTVIVLTVFLFSRSFSSNESGYKLRIIGPDYEGYFDLEQDKMVEVEGPLGITKVFIRNGEAWIEDSPCREKICIKMGRLKRPGEQAVCIPNRVVIEVEGKNRFIDAVSR